MVTIFTPSQVSQVDHECVQATALKIVFDLLHIYGFEAFNIISEKGRGSPEETVSVQCAECVLWQSDIPSGQ